MAKKPEAKNNKPAAKKITKPADKKKPAAVPKETRSKTKPIIVTPKALKVGSTMTLAKLKKLTGEDGYATFVLPPYGLFYLLEGFEAQKQIIEDVERLSCPPGYTSINTTVRFWDGSRMRNTIELLAKTKVILKPVDPVVPEFETPVPYLGPTANEVLAETPAETNIVQDDPEAGITETPKTELVVSAKVSSDDREHSCTFDAEAWFKQATDDQIIDLATEHYGHDFTSDAIVIFMGKQLDGVKTMMDYVAGLKGVPGKSDVAGYGCEVDDIQAIAWVEKNRPHLLPRLTEIHDLGEDEAKVPG